MATTTTTRPIRASITSLTPHFSDGHAHGAPAGSRQSGDDRADPDDGPTEPEPRDARDDPRTDRGPRQCALVVRGEDRIEVVAQAGADPRRAHRRRAVGVLHECRPQMLARAVSADREIGDDRIALRLAHRADRVETNGVTGDL